MQVPDEEELDDLPPELEEEVDELEEGLGVPDEEELDDVLGRTTTNGEKEFVTPVIVFEPTFTFVVIFFQALFSKCKI